MRTLIAAEPYPRPWRVELGWFDDAGQPMAVVFSDHTNSRVVFEVEARQQALAEFMVREVNLMESGEFEALVREWE